MHSELYKQKGNMHEGNFANVAFHSSMVTRQQITDRLPVFEPCNFTSLKQLRCDMADPERLEIGAYLRKVIEQQNAVEEPAEPTGRSRAEEAILEAKALLAEEHGSNIDETSEGGNEHDLPSRWDRIRQRAVTGLGADPPALHELEPRLQSFRGHGGGNHAKKLSSTSEYLSDGLQKELHGRLLLQGHKVGSQAGKEKEAQEGTGQGMKGFWAWKDRACNVATGQSAPSGQEQESTREVRQCQLSTDESAKLHIVRPHLDFPECSADGNLRHGESCVRADEKPASTSNKNKKKKRKEERKGSRANRGAKATKEADHESSHLAQCVLVAVQGKPALAGSKGYPHEESLHPQSARNMVENVAPESPYEAAAMKHASTVYRANLARRALEALQISAEEWRGEISFASETLCSHCALRGIRVWRHLAKQGRESRQEAERFYWARLQRAGWNALALFVDRSVHEVRVARAAVWQRKLARVSREWAAVASAERHEREVEEKKRRRAAWIIAGKHRQRTLVNKGLKGWRRWVDAQKSKRAQQDEERGARAARRVLAEEFLAETLSNITGASQRYQSSSEAVGTSVPRKEEGQSGTIRGTKTSRDSEKAIILPQEWHLSDFIAPPPPQPPPLLPSAFRLEGEAGNDGVSEGHSRHEGGSCHLNTAGRRRQRKGFEDAVWARREAAEKERQQQKEQREMEEQLALKEQRRAEREQKRAMLAKKRAQEERQQLEKERTNLARVHYQNRLCSKRVLKPWFHITVVNSAKREKAPQVRRRTLLRRCFRAFKEAAQPRFFLRVMDELQSFSRASHHRQFALMRKSLDRLKRVTSLRAVAQRCVACRALATLRVAHARADAVSKAAFAKRNKWMKSQFTSKWRDVMSQRSCQEMSSARAARSKWLLRRGMEGLKWGTAANREEREAEEERERCRQKARQLVAETERPRRQLSSDPVQRLVERFSLS